jgi:antitoxin component of RelBE/YafQ-DinJ toxin-antitoxin module
MSEPVSRKKNGQMSVRLDEELLTDYKTCLEKEGLTLTEDIETYIKSRIAKTPHSAQIGFRITAEEKNAFEEILQKQGKKSSEVLLAFVREYIQKYSGDKPINEKA